METKKGLINAIVAFFLWGLYPLYWNLLSHITPNEVLANRMIWSFLMLGLFVCWKRRQALHHLIKEMTWKRGILLFLAAFLLAANWLIYTWAVNNGRILYASLGYYVNPIVSISMGVLILKETLTPLQRIAIGIATIGILYFAISLGSLPWISLTLAGSFATYGLIKKILKLDSLLSLFLEMTAMFPFALAYLGRGTYLEATAFHQGHVPTIWLLVGAGVVTLAPLIFFNRAAQLIPLKYIGIIQYLGPTLGFLISVFIFREPFTRHHLVAFSFIWLACFVFAGSNLKLPMKFKLKRG